MTKPNDSIHPYSFAGVIGVNAGAEEYGLTKREYLAGLQMQPILRVQAERCAICSEREGFPIVPDFVLAATQAVEAADALIAALNEEVFP